MNCIKKELIAQTDKANLPLKSCQQGIKKDSGSNWNIAVISYRLIVEMKEDLRKAAKLQGLLRQ